MDSRLTLESRLEGASARIDSYEKGTSSRSMISPDG